MEDALGTLTLLLFVPFGVWQLVFQLRSGRFMRVRKTFAPEDEELPDGHRRDHPWRWFFSNALLLVLVIGGVLLLFDKFRRW